MKLCILFLTMLLLNACSTLSGSAPAASGRSAAQSKPPTDDSAVRTAIAADIFATQTASVPTPSATARATATSRPTATPRPSHTPTPTKPTAKLTQNASLYADPDEGYEVVTEFSVGAEVEILHRSGEWFEVQHTNGKTGWLRQDWVDLPGEAREHIPLYPKALPVIVGNVIQDDSGYGTVFFKARVVNGGARTAYWVEMELELYDASEELVDIVSMVCDPWHVPAEGTTTCQGYTDFNYDAYITNIRWKVSE